MPIEAMWKHSSGITRAGSPRRRPCPARARRSRAAAELAHRVASGLDVVEQHAGVLAARVAIDRQQRLQPRAEVRHARIGVGHRARRADRRAAAAARAQVRLDLDLVAVGADRAGRADVEALRAAGLARAAVRADALVVVRRSAASELADQRRSASARRAPARADRRPARRSPAAGPARGSAAGATGRAPGRSVPCAAAPCARNRWRSPAPQALTQSRCALHLSRSIW